MAQPVRISAVVITLNEAQNIGRCLDSLAGLADEVLVVDSGSTDATEAIVRAHPVNARWLHQDWLGYRAQKQFAAEHAQHDCILSLDADEALDEPLRAAVAAAKADWRHAAYELNRLTNWCGHWVRHGGWYPDRKLRLYDRRRARWAGGELHEYLAVDAGASTGRLPGHLLHYSYYTIGGHVAQANRFTDLGARALVTRGKQVGWAKLWLAGPFKFVRDYVLRGGFRDGFAGFVIAGISAHATFLKYAKARQLQRAREGAA